MLGSNVSHNLLLDGHLVSVAQSSIGLTMTQGGECSDLDTQGLSIGHQSVTLQVGVHLNLDMSCQL